MELKITVKGQDGHNDLTATFAGLSMDHCPSEATIEMAQHRLASLHELVYGEGQFAGLHTTISAGF